MDDCEHHFKTKPDGTMVCERCGATMTVSPMHTPAADLEIKPDKYARRRRTEDGIANTVKNTAETIVDLISWWP
jgi:hypothetical protein